MRLFEMGLRCATFVAVVVLTLELYELNQLVANIPRVKDKYAERGTERVDEIAEYKLNAPLIWVQGGSLGIVGSVDVMDNSPLYPQDVNIVGGNVEVSGEVEVSGDVEIEQPWGSKPLKVKVVK